MTARSIVSACCPQLTGSSLGAVAFMAAYQLRRFGFAAYCFTFARPPFSPIKPSSASSARSAACRCISAIRS